MNKIAGKKIWCDITNVPHVNFLNPIYEHFKNKNDFIFSLRDFAETKLLFEKRIDENYQEIGSHFGSNKLAKIYGVGKRIIELQKNIDSFDVKISVGGDASSIVAKMRRKYSITFDDNEKAPNWRYSKFSDLAFWPSCIDTETLKRQGFKVENTFRYDGYKEDFYLADYMPDENFLNTLPFKEYIVVRPENIQANYVNGNGASITRELLNELIKIDINILFLPRYDSDINYAKGLDNIFIPNSPVNGLDACFYSKAVFTGAGTMAREAACLGVPAFSFYAGKELLTVDQSMIKKNWTFFSRNPNELVKRFIKTNKRNPDLERSKEVQKSILEKLEEVIM